MLIEREEMLDALCDLAMRADAGEGALVLVSGEAGIGKSSLLSTFRERIGTHFDVAWGGCEALFTPQPLGPLHDMAGAFGPRIRSLLGHAERPSSIFHAVLDELAEQKDARILIFEDVHWADHATLDLLRFLGRRVPALKSLLILSYRDDEVTAEHPLSQAIGDLPQSGIHRLTLPPLTREGVVRMDSERTIDPDRILEITGGNPFFVTELLAAYRADGEVVPASIRDSVNARLARLSPHERAFLETMSVAPASFDHALVTALFGLDGETLAMACVGRKLLVEDSAGRLRFRHELARLATMSRMNSMGLQAAHGRILGALEQRQPTEQQLGLLVHHAAGALDAAKVLALAPEAGRVAAIVGAHREAAAHFATALQFADDADPELVAELHECWAYEAGIALKIDDDVIEARRHAITLWRALGRTNRVGDNLRWLSRLHWYRGEAAKANRFANEAVRILESTAPSGEQAKAYSLRAQLHMLNDRMPEAVEWGQKALAIADAVGDTETRVHALNNVGTALAYLGEERGVEMLQESLVLALDNDFHEHAARVYTNLGCYAVDYYRFALADKVINEGIAFDTRNDLDAWTHYLVGILARLRLEQGRLADAERIARSVLQIDRLTLLMQLPARIAIALMQLRSGMPEARQTLMSTLERSLATEEVQYIIPTRLALVEHAWLNDAPQRSHEQIMQLAEMDPAVFNPWYEGEVQAWARRTGFALRNRPRRPIAGPFAAELEGDGTRAADAWARLGAPYAAAISLIATAADDPASHLARAIRTLAPTGANAAIAKARRLAGEHGVTKHMPRQRRGPYRAARNNPLGLTRREQEILKLLATGATNRDIAEQLSRSQRTIEHHVSAILGKMNANTRFEAMLRVRNEPWIIDLP